MTFTIDSANVRTIAHWIPATSQVLEDWSQLRRIIDNQMMYGLKTELLMGDGLGVHLSGLITQATSCAASDQKLDTLRHAVLEAEDDDEEVDFIVLNPKDFHDIELIKDEAGGANLGSYVIGDARHLLEIKLHEASLVLFPMNEGAVIESVKDSDKFRSLRSAAEELLKALEG